MLRKGEEERWPAKEAKRKKGRVKIGQFFRILQTVFRIDSKVFQGQFRSADMPP